ncbi:MAG: N-6 DNA methylase [Cetobacterium sp.]
MDKEYKEFSYLEQKKKFMEFITPQKIRDILIEKVGKRDVVFDPCVGSGQLINNIDCRIKIGNDINNNAIEYAIENGIISTCCDYILFDDSNIYYDTVISNYPFSLKPTYEQKRYIESHNFLRNFTNYKGKFVGVLDVIFILKSFIKSEFGFYLCFPGISYRKNELKFRKYLFDNRFVKEVGLISNAGFQDTNISILYLELTKKKNEVITYSKRDLKDDSHHEFIVNYQDIDDDSILDVNKYIPDINNKTEKINIQEVEDSINKEFSRIIERELELDMNLLRCGLNNTKNIFIKLNTLIINYQKYINLVNEFVNNKEK